MTAARPYRQETERDQTYARSRACRQGCAAGNRRLRKSEAGTVLARPRAGALSRGHSGLYAEWGDATGEDKHTRWVADHMRALDATGTALPDENRLNRTFPFISDDNLRRLDELRETWDPEGRLVSWLGTPQLLT
jgi:hypothetical protein